MLMKHYIWKTTALMMLSMVLTGLSLQVSQSRPAAANGASPAIPFHARYHGTFTEAFGAGRQTKNQ